MSQQEKNFELHKNVICINGARPAKMKAGSADK